MNQTWENGKKKLILGLILTHFDPKSFFEDFTFPRYYTLLQAIIVCYLKENY